MFTRFTILVSILTFENQYYTQLTAEAVAHITVNPEVDMNVCVHSSQTDNHKCQLEEKVIIKVIKNYPLGTMNVCAIFNGNPSNS